MCVTEPATKVLDTLYYSCSSTALPVEISYVHAATDYTVSVIQERGASDCFRGVGTGMVKHQAAVIQEPSGMQ